MLNSGVLDVALGLTFVYTLLSLACTAINELVEGWLKIRASYLERGLRELLRNPTDPDDLDLVNRLYGHPLVNGLFRGHYDPSKIGRTSGLYAYGSNLPSYIPSRSFALAMLNLVAPARTVEGAGPTATADPAAGAGAGATGGGAPGRAEPLQPLRESISQIRNEAVRDALLILVDDAGADINRARDNVERWFDSSMDRVSGMYKRHAQKVVLASGLVLAILVNADTITIANTLSHDVGMRDSLVAAAQEYAKASSPPGQTASPPAQVAAEPATNVPAACRRDETSPECRVERNLTRIERLGLPLGWNLDDPWSRDDPRALPSGWGWVVKVVGWLLTAVAVSLGAPFWFDVLNKIAVVRATVKPREKSPEEPPVDRA